MNYLRLLKREEKKRLISNFFSLTLLQGVSYLLPLITFPYLIRVLGIEHFGLLSFATAIVAYFSIFVDYGFNLTATKEISIHREDIEKIYEIFSSVMIIKMILLTISYIVLFIIILYFEKLSKNWGIYVATSGIIAGQAIFPIWFFQGMEKMKYITYLSVISRVIFTATIFLVIKNEGDYYMVPILVSLSSILTGLLSLTIIMRKFKIKFRLQPISTLKLHQKKAHHIFLSNISVALYTMTTIVLLGFFTNNTVVGYYSIADKLIFAIKQLIAPLSQALYPYICKKILTSKDMAINIVKSLSIALIPLGVIATIVLFLFSEQILLLVFGSKALVSLQVFRILSLIPLLVVIDTLLGSLLMLAFDKNKEYSSIIISAGIISLMLNLLLIPLYQEIGAAVSVLLVEIYITFRIILFTQLNEMTFFK